jgi:hypothetical protein
MGGNHSSVDVGHLPGIDLGKILSPAKGAEFVSASVQLKTTTGSRFLLQGSLASPTDQIEQKTPVRGYKLFSNVQGEFISVGTSK